MKKTINPELANAINQQAHILATQSFSTIRVALQEKANALLMEGRSLSDTLRVIRTAGNQALGQGWRI